MRITGVMGAVVLAGAIAAATPAQAAIMAATFYGSTPYGGYDYAGIFGAPGSLAYKTASLTFTYDTNQGEALGPDFIYGGGQYGLSSPFLSAKVTIGEASYDLDLAQYAFLNSYPGEWTWLAGKQETPGNIPSDLSATFYHAAPGDLTAPLFEYGYGTGYFHLYKPDSWGELLAEAEFEFGALELSYVGPSPEPGAVPEPMSWALMIAGFGLAGAALRRRRAAVLA